MTDAPNYDPSGKTMRHFVIEGNLGAKVFVDIHSANSPYIVRSNPFRESEKCLDYLIQIVYVDDKSKLVTQNVGFAYHLDDPVYDGSRVNEFTSRFCVLDEEVLRKAKLIGVGD